MPVVEGSIQEYYDDRAERDTAPKGCKSHIVYHSREER